ncbi:peptidylprolyl isomerase [Pseudonocardia sp. CA-107938]|uniref:peptidylprolyl isomerase n=1 Tax=Pseudonocardia sp. CA-107938 TaxID=3240021 RepID=UPI003D8B071B
MATNQMRREAAKRKLERQQQRRIEQAKKRKRNVVITVVGVVAVAAVVAVVFALLPAPVPPPAAPDANALGNCTFVTGTEAAAKPAPVPPNGPTATTGTQAVAMQTSAGPIGLTLDRATGPCAVESFVSLAKASYFDGTPCHRLTTAGIKVLQCGDPSGTGSGGPGYTMNDEPPTHLPPGPNAQTATYPRGTVAMAKTSAPNSGGSQFFLVYGDSPLPPTYTVFGTVDADGLATLDKIAAAGEDGSNGQGDGKPKTPVTIEKVTVA